MPFPDASWLSQVGQNYINTFSSGGVDGAPPQHIIDYLSQVGTPWDPAKYSWDPTTGNLTDRASGGSWDMRSVPNNSLGSYVVLPGGATPTAESSTGTQVENNILPGGGPAYYFEPGQGPTFFGNPSGSGQFFFSNDPNAISEYKDDARTRSLQAAGQIAGLIGGGTLLANALGGGAAASGASAGSEALTGVTLPSSAVPINNALPYLAGTPAAASFGTGGLTAASIAAGAGGVKNALSGGGGGNNAGTPKWLDYALPGVNALLGANAANQAVDAETAAYQGAIDESRRQYDQSRADMLPWLTAGQGALTKLQDPNASYVASPDYEYIRSESLRDAGNYFSSKGGLNSGNALKALQDRAANVASTGFNDWWNRQAGVAGVGQNTANSLGVLGQNNAANVGGYMAGQGQARSSGVLGRTNAVQNGLYDGYYNFLNRRRA